jgi:hypothetical protein
MNSNQLTILLVIFSLLATPVVQGQEQLEQEPISIKGTQALPRTLYIAPWKRVGSPLEGGELDGEFKEETDPLEPDLFQRELDLHEQGYSVD